MRIGKSNTDGFITHGGEGSLVSRRLIITGLAACLGMDSLPTLAHDGVGLVTPPVEVPDIEIVSSDGFRGPLRERLVGRVSAIQLMFSKCKSICPIEAATFARVQEALAGSPLDNIQLLSLSIDPASDGPDVMKAWLQKFDAGPRWTAVAPIEADLIRTRKFFDGASSIGEDHSTAMSVINLAGMLTWRTSELPAPHEVVRVLTYLHGTRMAARP